MFKNQLVQCLLLVLSGICFQGAWGQTSHPHINISTTSIISNRSIGFIENQGQITDRLGVPASTVLFHLSTDNNVQLFVTEQGLTYIFQKNESRYNEITNDYDFTSSWERVDLRLGNSQISNENAILKGELPGVYNYVQSNCPKGVFNVKKYSQVIIKDVYPGIDWKLYNTTNGGFKYDFIVHPNANPDVIQLIYETRVPLSLKKNGNIEVSTDFGTMLEHHPISYIGDNFIESKFIEQSTVKKNGSSISCLKFAFSESVDERIEALIIDPLISWGTLFGSGVNEVIHSMDNDTLNNLYLCGTVNSGSFDFPLLNEFQGSNAGYADHFITKLDSLGVLQWSTFCGGSERDRLGDMVVDKLLNVYVVGETESSDFPLFTPTGAYTQGFQGGGNSNSDATIAKFDSNGIPIWITFFGDIGSDILTSVDIDANDNLFVGGLLSTSGGSITLSNSLLQNMPGAYYQSVHGIYECPIFAKFSSSGTKLWTTYYGGETSEGMSSINIDRNNNLYATGRTVSDNLVIQNLQGAYNQPLKGGFDGDAYIVKFDENGAMVWSTYYGGDGDERPSDIKADQEGNVYINGETRSTDFGVEAGVEGVFQEYLSNPGSSNYDVYLVKFNSSGDREWGTYFGGANQDFAGKNSNCLSFDHCGNVYTTFRPWSDSLPTKNHCEVGSYIDSTYNGGSGFPADGFIAEFSTNGEYLWGTYLGSDENEQNMVIAIDYDDNLYYSCTLTDGTTGSLPFVDLGGNSHYDDQISSWEIYIAKFTSPTPYITSISVDHDSCVCIGSAVVSISSSCAPFSYLWSNGVQSIDIESFSDTIVNLCPGDYSVQIITGCDTLIDFFTVQDDGNCETVVPSVVPEIIPQLELPNVFTPNGDGVNEFFTIETNINVEAHTIIVNRWGNKVFENREDLEIGMNNLWDGNCQSVGCLTNGRVNEGTYFYFVKLKAMDKNYSKQGFIQVAY